MGQGTACICPGTRSFKRKMWVVLQYRCNYSAFNGYRRSESNYSCVQCTQCGHVWRTKQPYVDHLPRREAPKIEAIVKNN